MKPEATKADTESDTTVAQMSERLGVRDSTAIEMLRRAWEYFGDDMVVTSSFQTQSVPLLHMVSKVSRDIPILFINTGFHFPETLSFRDELVARWKLRVVEARPEPGVQEDRLYLTDPDACCQRNKVEPFASALAGYRLWVSGIRQDQTPNRARTSILSETSYQVLKLCPLLSWSETAVFEYISQHALPLHPLHGKGYASIGCAPCTRPVGFGETTRSGRWAGLTKLECGLHTRMQ